MQGITGCLSLLLFGRPGGLRRRVARRVLGRPRAAAPPAAPTPPPPDAPPAAPADTGLFVDVLRVADVGPGRVVEVMFDGSPIAIANVDGRIHALSAVCPHAGGPLGEGTLSGTVLTCPNHGWTFDVTDGRCRIDPSIAVAILDVRVSGDTVSVRRPAVR